MNAALDFSNGRGPYEANVGETPAYDDGTPRPDWSALSDMARWAWSRGLPDVALIDELSRHMEKGASR